MEILLIDDASKDSTFKTAREAIANFSNKIKITILKNKRNLGYGGNQKLGYTYAIDNSFDIVALLHGDGQYAPEYLPNLLQPLIKEEAAAVFGSRMIYYKDALKGSMPIYKFLGNICLTFLQNKIAGTKLSEYHSGYRLYSSAALKKIPFEKNSDGFDFDTDIILQLHEANLKIKELPIPTFYGDEICYVNGLQYAFKILKTVAVYALQKRGIFYQSKFDINLKQDSPYKSKYNFFSTHSEALKNIDNNQKVFIFGCGNYSLVEPFIKKNCLLSLLDFKIEEDLKKKAVSFYETDLDTFDFSVLEKENHFPTVLILDVIEHLKNPEEFLNKLRELKCFSESKIIISTPNVVFFPLRIMFLLGMFNYGKRGILDKTHTRLFTFSSIRRILIDSGFEIEQLKGIPAPFPFAIKNNFLAKSLLAINLFLIKISKTLFSFQSFIICHIKPKVGNILKETICFSEDIRKIM